MTRIGLLLIAAAALLAVLWLALRPASMPVPPPTAAVSADVVAVRQAAGTMAADAIRRFALQPPAGGAAVPVLQVRAGDTVELQVTVPADDELHLHGYDCSLALHAGVTGTLRFTAEHAGRFDLELHHANAELAVLEVQPR